MLTLISDARKGDAAKQQAKDVAAQVTPQEFFDAAYEYQLHPGGMSARETKLVKLLATASLPPMQLGKLFGTYPVLLVPRPECLPPSPMSNPYFTSYWVADSGGAAIRYPDGHPSVDYDTRGSKYSLVSDPESEPDVLHQFWPLGYLAYQHSKKVWEYTGHVMVMDMDAGKDHQPWLVLASEWPDIVGEGTNDDFLCKAPRRVKRSAANVHGIFPGDKRRTPIGKCVHIGKSTSKLPFLKQFGPGFEFGVLRKGGRNTYTESKKYREYHPDLAHIMTWYWDDKVKQEVCYAENGEECMRYDPITGAYHPVNRRKISLVGQLGLWGEIIADATYQRSDGPVPIGARPIISSAEQPTTRRQRHEISTSGF